MSAEPVSPLVRWAGILPVAFIFCFFVWASFADVQEVTRGEGKVVPFSKVQLLQNSEPGIVVDILARVGQKVEQGQVILRLQNSYSQESLGEAQAKVYALEARAARLRVEQEAWPDGAFSCPQDVAEVSPEICENERRLFLSRRDALISKRDTLLERQAQKQSALEQTRSSIVTLGRNLEIAQDQLNLISPMVKRGLAPRTELARVELQVSQTSGEIEVGKESIVELEAAIREIGLSMTSLELDTRNEALKELTAVLADLAVARETLAGASDRIAQAEIRSPVTGILNRLDVTTNGAFLQAGSAIGEVVPIADELRVETRISPRDIAFVVVGQKALVRLSAYDFSIYGGLEGEVVNVSADSFLDEKSGENYYIAEIRTKTSALVLGEKEYPIIPGMICTVDIITGSKTIASYLLKPIEKAKYDALRER